MRRLPRRVHFGRDYSIAIHVVPPKFFKERYGETLAGAFENVLGKPNGVSGHIYIRASLSAAQKRATYWHELMHALHDIAAWDAHKLRT